MGVLANWRSGDLEFTITKRDGTKIRLLTVQVVDPQIEENVDIIDSLSQSRIGYHQRPSRIRVNLTTLGSQSGIRDSDGVVGQIQSDSLILTELQAFILRDGADYLEGFFDLTIEDTVNQSTVIIFRDCIVDSGGPMNIIMDQKPMAQWTLFALDAEIEGLDSKDAEYALSAGFGNKQGGFVLEV